MKITNIVFQSLFAVVLLRAIACGAECDPNQSEDPYAVPGVTIALTRFDVNETTLTLNYQMENHSGDRIWVCDDVDVRGYVPLEVFVTFEPNDGSCTLNVRRRLDVPTYMTWDEWHYGRYVPMEPNEIRKEIVKAPLPIKWIELYSSEWGQMFSNEDPLKWRFPASKLLVEIGAYYENLPAMIVSLLHEAEQHPVNQDLAELSKHFGGLHGYSFHNQDVSTSVIVPYTRQCLKGERILSISVNGVSIPWSKDRGSAAMDLYFYFN
jgi:hypothetical protein